jgi:hypothetical protein
MLTGFMQSGLKNRFSLNLTGMSNCCSYVIPPGLKPFCAIIATDIPSLRDLKSEYLSFIFLCQLIYNNRQL